jgi:hypothetical protein
VCGERRSRGGWGEEIALALAVFYLGFDLGGEHESFLNPKRSPAQGTGIRRLALLNP